MKRKQIQIPTARQLPSGNWFVQLRIDGRSISITKPTQREAVAEAMAVKEGIIKIKSQPLQDQTLTRAIDLWLADNEHRLSPSTVRGYVTIRNNGFQSLMPMKCSRITDKVIASAINAECREYSPKTVMNRWRFISQVLEWATGERINPNLPQVVKKEPKFLDEQELNTFLKHINGTPVEITALLALSSLRRSEIAALDWDRGDIDLEHRWIHVRGAVVRDRNNKLIRKETNKNSMSRRDVPIIDPLYKALSAVPAKQGRVVPQHPGTMRCRINRACEQAGVPVVGCHGLRHSFASLCHILHIPPQVAMEIGGWSDRATMDRIYTHVSRRTKNSYQNAFTAYFHEPDGRIANSSANAAEIPLEPQSV